MDNKDIGKRITLAREDKELNKKELADIVKVASSTIKRYEDGTIKRIKIPVIDAIARALNVNPLWLIGKSEQKRLAIIVETNHRKYDLVDEEIALIDRYRSLDDRGKKAVQDTIEREIAYVIKEPFFRAAEK